jgi:hypothetical protein
MSTEALILDGSTAAAAEDLPVKLLQNAVIERGSVLLRNLVADREAFLQLTERIAPGPVYEVVRTEASLELHGERCDTPYPPDILWLHCLMPAAVGGRTLVCDGVRVASDLSAAARSFFSLYPLVFERKHPPRIWQHRYKTDDKSRVLARSSKHPGTRAWFAGDTLCLEYTTPAFRETRWSHQAAFVNSLLHAVDSRTRPDIKDYGLSTNIPDRVLEEVRAVTSRHTLAVGLRRGDTLIVDNSRMMHGRETFKGSRLILTVHGTARF